MNGDVNLRVISTQCFLLIKVFEGAQSLSPEYDIDIFDLYRVYPAFHPMPLEDNR